MDAGRRVNQRQTSIASHGRRIRLKATIYSVNQQRGCESCERSEMKYKQSCDTPRSLRIMYISVEIRSLISLNTRLHRSRPRTINFVRRSRLPVTMSSFQSEVISTIDLSRVPVDAEIDIHKHDLKLISSYNWLSDQTPTILVPGNYSNPLRLLPKLMLLSGSPPQWSPPSVAPKLAPDSGRVFIDQNAYRNPSYPLEPLIRAVTTSKSDFDFSSIDIITDRNNLRKLLRAVTGDFGNNDRNFTITVECVGTTVLLTRREERSSEVIPPGQFRGFGHSFEKAYTKWPKGMELSTGHHRVIQYDFGGLRCLVRFEVDVCHGTGASGVGTETTPDADSVLGMLGRVSLGNDGKSGHTGVACISRGRLVPQDVIGEIKTRAIRRPLDMADVWPQLWFSHTQRLVVGYHQAGRFSPSDIEVTMAGRELEDWERRNKKDLQKLVVVLKNIIAEAKRHGDMLDIAFYGGSLLVLREHMSAGIRMPEDLKEKLK